MFPTQSSRADAAALKKIPLLQGLDEATLADVLGAATLIRKEACVLYRQGQAAGHLYAVLSGKVKVSQVTADGHQVVMRWAEPGNLVGGAPLFGADSYPAGAQVLTRSTLLAWSRKSVERLLAVHPRFALNTLHFLGRELSQLRQRFAELATQNVERRVARTLLRLVSQSGKREKGGVLVDFPISRQDLAQMTGTTLHTISRTLSRWEKAGLISLGRRRVLVRRPHELVALADDLAPLPAAQK